MRVLSKIIIMFMAFYIGLMPFQSIGYADSVVTVYVSPDGSDQSGDGTAQFPFKTLDSAIDKVNLMRESINEPAEIILRGGTYKLKKTISLDKNASNIKFVSALGEQSVISMNTVMSGSEFTKLTDTELLGRLPVDVRDSIYFINLFENGVSSLGTMQKIERHNQLYTISPPLVTVDSRPMTIAEWPNSGYTTITDYVYNEDGTYEFKTPENRATFWQDIDSVMGYGTFRYDYADDSFMLKEYDSQTGYYKGRDWLQYGMADGGLIKFINVFEELDCPGEWYADKNGVLYIYPDTDLSKCRVTYTSSDENLIEAAEIENVTFENIVFEGTCAKGIVLNDGNFVTIKNCEFRNIGQMAGHIDGTENVLIENCYFHDLGKGGIYVDAEGDKASLTSGNNLIKNCRFERFSIVGKRYCHAIRITDGVGMTVSKNTFSNSPHSAIMFDGNNHIIEYNDFYDLMNEGYDSGAVYSGRSWINGGTHVRYNYFHDMAGILPKEKGGRSCVYLDDGMAGIYIYGNVFNNVRTGIALHSAEYNTIENNLFANITNKTINLNNLDNSTDARIASMNKTFDYYLNNYHLYESEKDNLYQKVQRLLETYMLYVTNYNNQTWNTAYTYLSEITANQNAVAPKGNIIKNNITYLGAGNTETAMGISGLAKSNSNLNVIENNRELSEDAIFLDERGGNLADTSVLDEVFDGFSGLDVNLAGAEGFDMSRNDFGLIYPVCYAENVDMQKQMFVWEECRNTDRYRLIISEDIDFKNVVFDEIVDSTSYEVTVLEYGKTYYWKVYALALGNTEGTGENVKQNSEGVCQFSTPASNSDIVLKEMEISGQNGAILSDFVGNQINIVSFKLYNSSNSPAEVNVRLEAYDMSNVKISEGEVNLNIENGKERKAGIGLVLPTNESYMKLIISKSSGEVLTYTIRNAKINGTYTEIWNDIYQIKGIDFYNEQGEKLERFERNKVNRGQVSVYNKTKSSVEVKIIAEAKDCNGQVIFSNQVQEIIPDESERKISLDVSVTDEAQYISFKMYSDNNYMQTINITEEMLKDSKLKTLTEITDVYYTDMDGNIVSNLENEENGFVHIKVKNIGKGYLPLNIFVEEKNSILVLENLYRAYKFVPPNSETEFVFQIKGRDGLNSLNVYAWTEYLKPCMNKLSLN